MLLPKNKKTILLLGARAEQTIAIKLAKKMGLKVIALDESLKAPGLKYADIRIRADIKDHQKIIKLGRQYKIDGIMAHGLEIPVVIAKAAKALGLPHLNPTVADRATNKLKRITCFQKKGVLCPKFASASSFREAEEKSKNIGFPLVIKPIGHSTTSYRYSSRIGRGTSVTPWSPFVNSLKHFFLTVRAANIFLASVGSMYIS
jgi:formate-dependent phosphoribosylglycinamide formyltransferase (GAR transformylase)